MSGQSLVWIAWILAILWFGGCAVLLGWSIWGDAGGKLRRCPRCWHDLSHTDGLTCSECGHSASNEKSLHGRKPRRLAAYGSLGAALLGALIISQRVGNGGLLGMAPTRALIWLLPWTSDPIGGGVITTELTKRLLGGAVSVDDSIALAEVCIAADQAAPLRSPLWESGYGSLLEAVTSSTNGWSLNPNTRPGLTASLARLDAVLEVAGVKFSLDAPTSWNAGEPLMVRLWMKDWRRIPKPIRLTLESPQSVDGCTDWALSNPEYPELAPLTWNVGVLPAGPQEVTVVLRWQWRDDRGDWIAAPEIGHRFKIDFIEPRQLTSLAGAQVEAEMRAVVNRGLLLWGDGPPRAGFRLSVGRFGQSDFNGAVFGVQIQALEDGVPRRTLRAWWRGGLAQSGGASQPRNLPPADPLSLLDDYSQPGGSRAWELAEEDLDALARARDDQTGWTLRVQGLPELAARAAHLDPHSAMRGSRQYRNEPTWADDSADFVRYWDGSFEIPLRVTHLDSQWPDRPWTRIPAPAVR